jgi:hypothetical protein
LVADANSLGTATVCYDHDRWSLSRLDDVSLAGWIDGAGDLE